MHLREEIESGKLKKKCAPEELEKVNQFIALLAKEGALPDDSQEDLSLEMDVEELLNRCGNLYEYTFSLGIPDEYIVAPAIFNGHEEVVLCKNWVKKQWDGTKKLVKKHKKAIIFLNNILISIDNTFLVTTRT